MKREKTNIRETKAITKIQGIVIIVVLAVAAIGGGFAYLSFFQPKSKVDDVVLQLDWIASGYHSDLYVAKDRFWPNLGLDVTIVRGAGSDDTARKVGMGVAEFGMGGFDAGTQVRCEESIQIKTIFAAGVKNLNGLFYIKGRDAGRGPIDLKANMKSLEGKIYGGPATGLPTLQLPMFSSLVGVDYSKIEVVDMEPGAMVPALLSGTVDVIDCGAGPALTYMEAAAAEGLTGDYVLFENYGLHMIADTIWTSDRLIKENPDLVARFVEGLQLGFKYAAEHLDEAVATFIKYNPAFAGREQAMKNEWIADYGMVTDKTISEKNGIGYLPDSIVSSSLETVYLMYNIEPQRKLVSNSDIYTTQFIHSDIYPSSWPW